jgi:glycosyltransferase involved in cell wall biosynthesis
MGHLMPEWKLVVVGDGSNKNKYIQYAQQHKLSNILFVGLQNPYEYYCKSAIFMMTSAFEGMPMTLLEAQQMGVVPIAMDSFQGLHGMVENNATGIIVPDGDIASFTHALLKLMSDDKERIRLAKNAVGASEKFNIETILDKWEMVFDNLRIS